jgi:hypothetical protein
VDGIKTREMGFQRELLPIGPPSPVWVMIHRPEEVSVEDVRACCRVSTIRELLPFLLRPRSGGHSCQERLQYGFRPLQSSGQSGNCFRFFAALRSGRESLSETGPVVGNFIVREIFLPRIASLLVFPFRISIPHGAS